MCPSFRKPFINHFSFGIQTQQAYDFSLRTKPTEVMLSELIFLRLFVKLLTKLSNITNLWAKVVWRNLNFKGQIITYACFHPGLQLIHVIAVSHSLIVLELIISQVGATVFALNWQSLHDSVY